MGKSAGGRWSTGLPVESKSAGVAGPTVDSKSERPALERKATRSSTDDPKSVVEKDSLIQRSMRNSLKRMGSMDLPSDRGMKIGGDPDRAGLMNSRQRPECRPSLTVSLENVLEKRRELDQLYTAVFERHLFLRFPSLFSAVAFPKSRLQWAFRCFWSRAIKVPCTAGSGGGGDR